MLPDFERKLLRILYNFSLKYRRMPDWRELKRLTGRQSIDEIKSGLLRLEGERYMVWQNKFELDSIVILEGWDREKPVRVMENTSHRTEYWTGY